MFQAILPSEIGLSLSAVRAGLRTPFETNRFERKARIGHGIDRTRGR